MSVVGGSEPRIANVPRYTHRRQQFIKLEMGVPLLFTPGKVKWNIAISLERPKECNSIIETRSEFLLNATLSEKHVTQHSCFSGFYLIYPPPLSLSFSLSLSLSRSLFSSFTPSTSLSPPLFLSLSFPLPLNNDVHDISDVIKMV